MTPQAVLIVDVDGVVSPVHGVTAWGDDVVAGRLFGPVRTSPTLCAELDLIATTPGLTCLWLTSWDSESRAAMSPFPGATWATLAGRVRTRRAAPLIPCWRVGSDGGSGRPWRPGSRSIPACAL